MSEETWVQTVKVGENLSITGPNGVEAHSTGVLDAYNAGLVRIVKNGVSWSPDALAGDLTGVDIIRIR